MNVSLSGAISEDYYQISEAILSSFPKYHPPLNLYRYNEAIRQLTLHIKKGHRLSKEESEALFELCKEGHLFVARSDHAIYAQHIVKQLDLILLDNNLNEKEIISICLEALRQKLESFFAQPVKTVYLELYTDLMVVTEYLWADLHRLRGFVRNIHTQEFSLEKHSINTLFLGLWLFCESQKNKTFEKKLFDQAALALLLHDVGMCKIPAFITGKRGSLKNEEWDKVIQHPLLGNKIIQKLDIVFDLATQAAMEHHERVDGSGYPQKTGEAASFARLTAVADALSAMIQDRSYASKKPIMSALKELSSMPKQFDASYANLLLAAFAGESFGPIENFR